MSLIVAVNPEQEPLTLEEVKLHLRVVAANTSEDLWINSAISAARKYAETECQISIMRQTLRLTRDCFEHVMELPKGPVSAITSVKYLDMAEVQQTVPGNFYALDSSSNPGRLTPKFGNVWPVTLPQIAAVQIDYVVGVATREEVEDGLKAWMKVRIESLYRNRGETSTQGPISSMPYIDRMLDPYRTMYMPS